MKKEEFLELVRVFENNGDVDNWLSITQQKINYSNSGNVLRQGLKYIEDRTREIIIENHFKVDFKSIKPIPMLNLVPDDTAFFKHILIGAGIGFAMGLFIGGSMLILMISGGVLGMLSGNNKIAESVKCSLVEQSEHIANELYKLMRSGNNATDKRGKERGTILIPPRIDKMENIVQSHSQNKGTKELTQEQQEIKDFLDERNIKYLIHFTDTENIESIKKYGILSVQELKNRNIAFKYNDENRMDNKLDYISLSISTINRWLINNFISSGKLNDPSIIYIDASILYKEINTHRYYCDRNAAAGSCQKSSNIDGLINMFPENLQYQTTTNSFYYDREYDMRKENEPTDIQAEILYNNRVDPKYIVKIEKWR